MRRARLPPVLILLLVLASVGACGTGPPDHVRIGLVAPLTGPRAFIGRELLNGAQLAIEDLNEAGGLLGAPVELVVEDDGDLVDLPGQLADLAERSRVSAIVGPEAPGILLGPRSPLTRRDVPAVLPASLAGQLEDASSVVVRAIPSARDQAEALGRWLTEVRRITRVAVLIADAVEGDAAREGVEEGLAAGGAEVVAVEVADPSAAAISPAVRALRRAVPGAQAVLLWGQPPAAARATRAVRALDWDVQVAVPASAFVSEYRTLAGDASESVVLAFPFDDDWFGQRFTSWMVRYYFEHGLSALPQLQTLVLDVPVIAVAAYDAVGLIGEAVKSAGTRVPEEVGAALTEVSYDGILQDYRLHGREAWQAEDLGIARFHHLAVTWDADPRYADTLAGRRLWQAQIDADYIPERVLEGPAGDIIRRLIERGRQDPPTYQPPRPPPGPVAGGAEPRSGEHARRATIAGGAEPRSGEHARRATIAGGAQPRSGEPPRPMAGARRMTVASG